MSNEEDRLTKNEFAELIQHLSVQEILTIEYRIGTIWSKLFTRKNVTTNTFVCNLCALETSSFKNLLAHIDGKKHKLQMDRVKQLFHPDYTYPKNDKKEFNEKSVAKKLTSAAIPQPKKLANIASIAPKNAPKANTSISESTTSDNNVSNEKSEQKTENKTTDESITSSNNLKTNNIVDTKSISTSSILFNQKELNDSNKTSTDIGKQEKLSEEKTSDHEKPDKESTSLLNDQDKIEKSEIKSTIQNGDKSKSDKECEKAKSLNLDDTKRTGVKFAEKRSLLQTSDNKMVKESNVKKVKLLINPAAVLKANSLNENKSKTEHNEKPQYQTDKIIIPTAHKSKLRNEKDPPSLSSQPKDLPKFSVKSYSSKPSDNDVYGILGVEYVIKILKNRNDISPRYECGLCELVLAGFAMQRHLEGYNHRLKFCEKHFPTAIRHYRQYMQSVPECELYKVMTPVLAKLAVAIEQHHGRNLPYECYEGDFILNRHEILAKAFSCRHASEQFGPTFTHVVGAKEIDDLINERHKYLPPISSRSAIFDIKPGNTSRSDIRHDARIADNEPNSQNRDRNRHGGRECGTASVLKKYTDNTQKSYLSSAGYDEVYPSNFYKQTEDRNVQHVQHVQHVDDKTYNLMVDDFLKGTLKGISNSTSRLRNHRKRSASPVHTSSMGKRKSISPLRQNDIWQAYRHMVDQELHNVDDRFKEYRKDPETHPSYNEEWQKFWKRRKDELISAGLDHRKYNYQPEWVRFVKIRIEELYSEEVENLKIKSRERLCLPMTNNNLVDSKYHVQAPTDLAITSAPSNTYTNTTNSLTAFSSSELSNEGVPQVVSILRLMTALEDCLGSLGPKIIDLLSKALQAEKTNPAQVNAIILTNENCSLIETAKEKFKGLIITGLFEGSKERVLKQVVNDAELLLKYANQFRNLPSQSKINSTVIGMQNNSSQASFKNQLPQNEAMKFSLGKTQSSTLNLSENVSGRMNKKELASKLAATLVAQGRTDFEPQQLQELIAVYTLIEKKKRNAGIISSNKSSSVQATSSSKKTLSDTLSDILKSSSSTIHNDGIGATFQNYNSSNAPQSANRSSTQNLNVAKTSSNTDAFQHNYFRNAAANTIPSGSFSSISQKSSGNYINNTAQSTDNAYSSVSGRGNLLERNNYGLNYENNQLPHSNMSGMYNNQYQDNNRMAQNWRWNSNMEVNQNYAMGAPNNCNQTTNWRNF